MIKHVISYRSDKDDFEEFSLMLPFRMNIGDIICGDDYLLPASDSNYGRNFKVVEIHISRKNISKFGYIYCVLEVSID